MKNKKNKNQDNSSKSRTEEQSLYSSGKDEKVVVPI